MHPFQRKTYSPFLSVEMDSERLVRFVDANAAPLAWTRVAALVEVHNSTHIRGMTWGPRYQDFVVAAVAVTASDGSVACRTLREPPS